MIYEKITVHSYMKASFRDLKHRWGVSSKNTKLDLRSQTSCIVGKKGKMHRAQVKLSIPPSLEHKKSDWQTLSTSDRPTKKKKNSSRQPCPWQQHCCHTWNCTSNQLHLFSQQSACASPTYCHTAKEYQQNLSDPRMSFKVWVKPKVNP